MLTADQRAAAIVTVSKQLEVVGLALDAAHAALAVLASDADEGEGDDAEIDERVATDDPATCGHPDAVTETFLGQRLCNSCGLNLDG